MKRVLATILAVIYFTATTGAAIHIHYCMGKMQSVNLWYSVEKKKICSNCGMTNKKGCCEDKHEVVKIEKKYNIPVTDVSATKISNLKTEYYTINPVIIPSDKIVNSSSSHSPPGKGAVSLFIYNCVFLV